MDLTAVAIGVVLFVLLLPNAYSAWFTTDKYRKGMRKARARLQGHPESIFYGDLERHPKLDINWPAPATCSVCCSLACLSSSPFVGRSNGTHYLL